MNIDPTKSGATASTADSTPPTANESARMLALANSIKQNLFNLASGRRERTEAKYLSDPKELKEMEGSVAKTKKKLQPGQTFNFCAFKTTDKSSVSVDFGENSVLTETEKDITYKSPIDGKLKATDRTYNYSLSVKKTEEQEKSAQKEVKKAEKQEKDAQEPVKKAEKQERSAQEQVKKPIKTENKRRKNMSSIGDLKSFNFDDIQNITLFQSTFNPKIVVERGPNGATLKTNRETLNLMKEIERKKAEEKEEDKKARLFRIKQDLQVKAENFANTDGVDKLDLKGRVHFIQKTLKDPELNKMLSEQEEGDNDYSEYAKKAQKILVNKIDEKPERSEKSSFLEAEYHAIQIIHDLFLKEYNHEDCSINNALYYAKKIRFTNHGASALILLAKRCMEEENLARFCRCLSQLSEKTLSQKDYNEIFEMIELMSVIKKTDVSKILKRLRTDTFETNLLVAGYNNKMIAKDQIISYFDSLKDIESKKLRKQKMINVCRFFVEQKRIEKYLEAKDPETPIKNKITNEVVSLIEKLEKSDSRDKIIKEIIPSFMNAGEHYNTKNIIKLINDNSAQEKAIWKFYSLLVSHNQFENAEDIIHLFKYESDRTKMINKLFSIYLGNNELAKAKEIINRLEYSSDKKKLSFKLADYYLNDGDLSAARKIALNLKDKDYRNELMTKIFLKISDEDLELLQKRVKGSNKPSAAV